MAGLVQKIKDMWNPPDDEYEDYYEEEEQEEEILPQNENHGLLRQ